MADLLINLLLVIVVLAVIFGLLRLFVPKLPEPFGTAASIILYGIMAVLLILYVLVPLIHMLPLTV